ncbi:MAG: methylenetetrahydrofolate reductase [Firmicutes bacterium]|nr:methylenetetrahydrofolate reductase [Bacillota bacterium]MCL5039462.1 methylenetetrahydrofolate reductase [Bacillota bacterium]
MKSGSNLEKVLTSGQFAVCGEMGPPQSADGKSIKKKAEYFRGYVDSVNLTDNQTAIVRLSSIASAHLLLDAGVEPVMQMTCRDRNRIAIQSDVLGAYALGIKNILAISGDHQKFGNHPQSKNVYDIDSLQLLQILKNMRDEKKFQNGEEMKVEPRLFIGAAANPFADPFEFRVLRLAKKVKAGADFIQTQGVFDVPRFKRWMEMVRDLGLPEKTFILAGIIPVRSVKALQYMKSEVAGMSVPDELIERMSKAAKPQEEGVKIAVELIQQLREIKGVHGVHIMPVMWEQVIPQLVEQAGLLPRPRFEEEQTTPAKEAPAKG